MQFYAGSSTWGFFPMRFYSLFRDPPAPNLAFYTGSSTGGARSMRIYGPFYTPSTQNLVFYTGSSTGGGAPKTARGPFRQVNYVRSASWEKSKKCGKTCFCAQARYSRPLGIAWPGLASEILSLFTVSLLGRLGVTLDFSGIPIPAAPHPSAALSFAAGVPPVGAELHVNRRSKWRSTSPLCGRLATFPRCPCTGRRKLASRQAPVQNCM